MNKLASLKARLASLKLSSDMVIPKKGDIYYGDLSKYLGFHMTFYKVVDVDLNTVMIQELEHIVVGAPQVQQKRRKGLGLTQGVTMSGVDMVVPNEHKTVGRPMKATITLNSDEPHRGLIYVGNDPKKYEMYLQEWDGKSKAYHKNISL